MGHYYSEMRGLEPHEKLEDFLKSSKAKQFTIKAGSKELTLSRNDIEQILSERSRARGELEEIKSLFRRLSRSGF
jgi:hypothetical protein